ncbi:hypothetical protein AJ79_03559 [Helicocarpus griseus UAMH5409]|uniref:Uncharacterized protein n=1 Tax=Helicocarpus griseus UAMH5409 TaxID=1447875 RepID=A0A2B7XWJ0_9EURO|nr:hypothetical protein AJ79_03559 [Helicocarpus griseus UAMH5409]
MDQAIDVVPVLPSGWRTINARNAPQPHWPINAGKPLGWTKVNPPRAYPSQTGSDRRPPSRQPKPARASNINSRSQE